ncbi:ketopantoate reductase family protein [Prolixibacter denitrificans]|nr:2-dehydropantoate 2-reductase [Prolixibacter denitrificans]PSK85165.1 2-dehydropantoate 2-reductase [Prolixibacter denitrificans]
MKIAIYGAGSLGTVIGAYLTKAGLDVDLINRNRAHVEGMKTNGAHITGTIDLKVPVKAFLPEEMSEKYDIIFLLTKQQENKKVVQQIARYLNKDGIICTAQNGFPELSVAEVIGEEKTFGCTIAWGATLLGNGVSELTSSPDSLTFSIGALSHQNEKKLHQIKEILEVMGTVDIERNFVGARWSKLAINSAFSGVSTVLGCTIGEAAQNNESRKCIQTVMKECFAVADAAGIQMEPIQGRDLRKLLDYTNRLKQLFSFMIIPIAMRKHARLKASMLQDLEKGKRTEVDAINGVVTQYGKEYHVATPSNDKVVEIIHGIEAGNYTPSFENVRLFV